MIWLVSHSVAHFVTLWTHIQWCVSKNRSKLSLSTIKGSKWPIRQFLARSISLYVSSYSKSHSLSCVPPSCIPLLLSCFLFCFFHIAFLFSDVLYIAVVIQASVLLRSTSVVKKKKNYIPYSYKTLNSFVTKSVPSDVCVCVCVLLTTTINPVLRFSPLSSFLPH